MLTKSAQTSCPNRMVLPYFDCSALNPTGPPYSQAGHIYLVARRHTNWHGTTYERKPGRVSRTTGHLYRCELQKVAEAPPTRWIHRHSSDVSTTHHKNSPSPVLVINIKIGFVIDIDHQSMLCRHTTTVTPLVPQPTHPQLSPTLFNVFLQQCSGCWNQRRPVYSNCQKWLEWFNQWFVLVNTSTTVH